MNRSSTLLEALSPGPNALHPCVIDAYWQHPPKGKGKRGRVRFEMDKKKHFKGWYTYKEAAPDTQSTPNWTGSK